MRYQPQFLEVRPDLVDCLRLIDVAVFRPGSHLELVMDDEKGVALAYLVAGTL